MAEEAYLIGASDQALWMGLGPTRLAVLATAVLLAVTAGYAGTPLPLAALPLAVAAAWCFGVVRGAALHELTLAGASLASRFTTGNHQIRASLDAHAPARPAPDSAPTALELPRACGRLALAALEVDGLEVGVLCERGRQGWDVLCLLRVVGDSGFSLLDPVEQTRRLSGWGEVLTALAGEYADRCRLQWVETAAPAQTGQAAESGLTAAVAAQSLCHRTLLAVRVSTGQRDRTLATRSAEPLSRLLASRLLSAELIGEPLSRVDVQRHLRLAMTGTFEAPDLIRAGPAIGPASHAEAWDHLRTDDTWHRSYLITGWPRIPVGPAWLSPLLAEGPTPGWRSVAMHFHAVRPELAGRRARAARQSASLDVDDRTRLGFGVGARERRTQLQADAVEEELAAGHVQHRVAGLILVSANSQSDLDDACRQTIAAASAARLDVHALHGRHADGWAAALPLCRLGHRSPA